MNIFKKILAYMLAVMMLVSVIPAAAFAEDGIYRIENNYMSFSFNKKTGGFAIETAEGNPQKILDDNIPLLYAEDEERSNGTSFITVRIKDKDGEKDYVFGQDYSFFKILSPLGEPEVKQNGLLMEIPWEIKGLKITLKAALDANANTSKTGNVGLSFVVENNSGEDKEVSVRLLLDTALGNKIDAPYFVVDDKVKATLTETEYSNLNAGKGNVPGQIRSVDSLTNPAKLSYILTNITDSGTIQPNRVILGHWANLANTRYDYVPDEYCDFTNYSNKHREPDSAAAVYWESNGVKAGETFEGQVLYGVGNFSDAKGSYPMGVNITTERVSLAEDGKSYKNGGVIKVTVELDNTVDNAQTLTGVVSKLSFDEDKFDLASSNTESVVNSFTTVGHEVLPLMTYYLKAKEQSDLSSGTVYVSVSGTKVGADGTDEEFETAAERSIILPSVGTVSEVQLNKINPQTVYTDGEKAVTISGKMKALSGMLADDGGVNLVLYNETANHRVQIDRKKIAFIDEKFETLTFTTSETLVVGEYDIRFEIDNAELEKSFGGDTITCNEKLEVSADPKYRLKSYGMIALVRNTDDSDTDYDFFTFRTENEYLNFYHGEASATGEYGNIKNLKCDFGAEKEIEHHEIILTVRANLREMEDEATKERFWQADYADGDIIINNMLSYEGDTPLKILRNVAKNATSYKVEGDGLLKVVNSINVWRSKWNITAKKGSVYTLDKTRFTKADGGKVGCEDYTLAFGGAASMIQTIGGFAVDLKYGVLSSEWYKNTDGTVTYGIGFGGKISLPIKAKKDKGTDSDEGSSSATPEGGAQNPSSNTSTGTAYSDTSDLTTSDDALYEVLKNTFGGYTANEYMTGAISAEVAHLGTENQGGSSGGSQGGSQGGGGNQGSGTAASSTQVADPARTSSTGDKIKKDSDAEDGSLSAEVNNVLFGEKGKAENGVVKVDGTGFVGIDAQFSLALPEDVLGSFVSNAPGIFATVTINTIKNQYEINAGLKIKIIECEGVLAFKQVNVRNKDVIVPDKIEFYIRDGLKIPIAAPVLFMTGLGGGVNNLADTIGGEFTKLPPITLLLYTRLEAIGVLSGDFNASLSLSGMSLTGDLRLNTPGLEKIMNINAGISARWIEPWELSLYGNVNIIDGLIKGGITVTIADNYFYGYVFANICIPDSIPLVGGKTLAGVEAAVSHEFIGANIKIIGIKFGVKYYWGDKVTFGGNIDLSAPPRPDEPAALANDFSHENAIGYYGTNVYALNAMALEPTSGVSDDYNHVRMQTTKAEGQDALLFEVPYTGTDPETDDIEFYNPNNEKITLTPDDGNGGGNMILQDRENGKYIYITVTEESKIKNGEWCVKYKKDSGFEISSFSINGVSDIPELDATKTKITKDTTGTNNETKVNVEWKIIGTKQSRLGAIDVYLTEDKDILTKIQSNNNMGDVLGTNIYHKENANLETEPENATIVLPDALPSGKYYAVTTLSTDDGISTAISGSYIDFTNPKLPKKKPDAQISYGGNNEILVKVKDPADADYTHYTAQIVADDGTVLSNNVDQFEKGANFIFGKEALLKAGKSYHVEIKTLREEYKKSAEEENAAYKTYYYYADDKDVVKTNSITLPAANIPVLEEVKFNFPTPDGEINTNVNDIIVEYKFNQDVFVEMDLSGRKVYAFGVNPDPEAKSTYFRKDWKFVLDDLDDGDYVIDFTAYNEQKDHIAGSEVANIPNGRIAFTIDTSAPVLSLAQKSVKRSDDLTVVFGANTVIADENGKYVIEGLTEKSAILTLDGAEINENTAGVTIDTSGSFSIERQLSETEAFKSHVITAKDKAGNISKINVCAVREDGLSFDSLELYLDGQKINPDAQGVKTIEMRNGRTAKLSVYGISGNSKIEINDESIDWNVLYAKNAIEMNGGSIAALLPTQTAVKAKLVTANVGTGGKSGRSEGLSDYVVINIGNNTKNDLTEKIDEAKMLLGNNPNLSEEKKQELAAAIAKAENEAKNSQASEEDYTNAVNDLMSAMTAFTATSHSGGSKKNEKFKVSSVKTEHGSVKFSQTSVTKGNSLTITAVPDEGYTVADMLINGVSVGRKSVYTVASVDSNISVQVIFAEKSDEIPFTDVIKTDWFYRYVKEALEKGYMLGTSQTEFEPHTVLTRAMFVTVLHRIDGEKADGENLFKDVTGDAYYKNAVAWANKNDIVLGTSDTEFSPDADITREQMATILYRYAKYKGVDLSAGENTNIESYADYKDISSFAQDAFRYAFGSGLMVGKSNTTLNPMDTATRAEAATVFVRFAEMISKSAN